MSAVVWQGINISPYQPVLLTVKAMYAIRSRNEMSKDTGESHKKYAWCCSHEAQIDKHRDDLHT